MRYDVAPRTYSRIQANGELRHFETIASRDTKTGEFLMIADGVEITDEQVHQHAAEMNARVASGRFHVADVFPDGNPCNDAYFDDLTQAWEFAEKRRSSYAARGLRPFCVTCWDTENDGQTVSECDYEDAIFIGPVPA